MKPLSLELGGHAPVLVFDDADLERAVVGAIAAKFRNTGQSCIAANRIYVQEGIYESFLDTFVKATAALKVGNGMTPGVEIGPLIDESACAKALEHISGCRQPGARILCGGNRVREFPGYFLAPTVLADVADDCACMREETFAPVAPVTSFRTEEEAIQRANATPFGLSAYAFTRDLSRAFRLMERLEAGMLGLNEGVPTTSQAPFGGVKQSGWGRELGSEGIEAFLDTKHIAIGL